MTIDELVIIANMAGVDKPLGVSHLDALFQEAPSAIYYRFIYHLIQYMQPEMVVELGTLYGRCAAHMAAAKPECAVVVIDSDPKPEARAIVDRYKNIRLLCFESTSAPAKGLLVDKSADLILIDTTHDYDQVMSEIGAWLPKMKSGGVILIDDISENQSMVRAWDAIKDMFPNSVSLPSLHHSGFGAVII